MPPFILALRAAEPNPVPLLTSALVQTLGFVLGTVGVGLGFAARGWDTPYTIHRDLGECACPQHC